MGIAETGMEWLVTYYAYYNAFRFFAQTTAHTVRTHTLYREKKDQANNENQREKEHDQ